ncbi:hypothetical protein GDO86_017566 [Hymenochirus boettgeri]|uniref:NADPH oxidase organizer 1 n=1 Tax=Hymenochirus boettgeri TaxID=247094 RepID=A0A8T2IKH7_9PIPI|nr:hypothetical protein GDO86_017566 [Hymenochirus boettgeri]
MSFRRYPVDATGIGLVQHGKQKMYMVSVLWSDRNNILIYRTYEDFKELARELKKKFPLESGLVNKSDRIIPILGDIPLIFRSNVFSNRFIDRLRLIESYSQELLQIDAKISQSEDVITFFSPSNQDLAPSFDKNSLVVLPPDSDQGKKKCVNTVTSSAPVSQPVISQKYVCIESFETQDTKNRPFKVKKNETIDVLIKDTTGWWLVENEDKSLAWFPGPYLLELETAEWKYREGKSLNDEIAYFAVKGYKAQSDDEISMAVGVLVDVIEKSDAGWWRVCYNGRCGYVPAMFLRPYCNPHQKLQYNFNQNRFGSISNLQWAPSDPNRVQHSNAVETEDDDHKGIVHKRRSRSFDGFTDLITFTRNGALLPEDRPSNHCLVEWERQKDGESSSAAKDETEMIETVQSPQSSFTRVPHSTKNNLRKDSGFYENYSPYLPQVSSQAALNTRPPVVPPRPSNQEILSKCTTITRNAAQME